MEPVSVLLTRRGRRRHQTQRMKSRAARLFIKWHSGHYDRVGEKFVKTRGYPGGVTYFSADDLRRSIGRIAAMHGTHVCSMCKYEKRMEIPHVKSHESLRCFDLSDEQLISSGRFRDLRGGVCIET